MFDFIPIVVDGLCLTMYPQPPEYDIGTFIRPFRQARYFDMEFRQIDIVTIYYSYVLLINILYYLIICL